VLCARTLIGHELGIWAVDLVSRGGALDPSHPQPPSHNPSGLAASGVSVPEVVDGPSLLLHNQAPAGAQVLDHLLPPSMRAVLALDAQFPRRCIPMIMKMALMPSPSSSPIRRSFFSRLLPASLLSNAGGSSSAAASSILPQDCHTLPAVIAFPLPLQGRRPPFRLSIIPCRASPLFSFLS
jgi:hypothetical protein